jgi:hypothetical protein
MLLPVRDAPIERRRFEREAAIKFLDALQHADSFGSDFRPDAVAGVEGDSQSLHLRFKHM